MKEEKDYGVDIQGLMDLLEMSKKDDRSIILQSFISEFGPIPTAFGDKIRKLIGEN